MNKAEYNKAWREHYKAFRKLFKEGIATHGEEFYIKQIELKDKMKALLEDGFLLRQINIKNMFRILEIQSSWRIVNDAEFLLRMRLASRHIN